MTKSRPVPIQAAITITGDEMMVDFSGTATAVAGNLNAVPAIVTSAVAYCLRCVALALLQTDLPMNEGAFTPVAIHIPPGSLLDPPPPHAVAAGNVETSQRLVDVIFGALAQALPHLIPAASQGTMNNLTFGGAVRLLIGGQGRRRQRRPRPHEQHAYPSTGNTFPLRETYSLRRLRRLAAYAAAWCGLAETPPSPAKRRLARRRTGRPSKTRSFERKHVPGSTPGDVLRLETPGGGGSATP
jgi:N-methylhydantoinase B/oxoprolinase/acetone carboxylase alpha subunit